MRFSRQHGAAPPEAEKASTDAIRVQNLVKEFGKVRAVDGLTLNVGEGELFGLVGPDGAGKTTTMRLLSAVMDPTSGDGWVAGFHIVKEAEALKNHIGYMSQRFGLYPDLTVMENLDFYADIYGVARKGRGEIVDRLLAFSNLTPFKKRLAGNLSGGMKQKLGLACALVHKPKVLLLDEPTNGVDPVSRRDFWRILYTLLRERVTIFVSTAYLDEAERCNRLGLMHHGRLFATGTPEQVKGYLRGVLLEARCDAARKVAHVLRPMLPHDSVGMFGDRIHVMTSNEEQARDAIMKACRELGLHLDSVERAEPTLEDVFVSVLASDEAGESA